MFRTTIDFVRSFLSSQQQYFSITGLASFIALGILLIATPVTAMAANGASSKPADEACTSCHVEMDHSGLDGTDMRECVNCHGSAAFEKMTLAKKKFRLDQFFGLWVL